MALVGRKEVDYASSSVVGTVKDKVGENDEMLWKGHLNLEGG